MSMKKMQALLFLKLVVGCLIKKINKEESRRSIIDLRRPINSKKGKWKVMQTTNGLYECTGGLHKQ